MRIKKIIWQNRRDFEAEFICPFCGYEEKIEGYDDANYHKNVIPELPCKECGKREIDGNKEYRPLQTTYPEGFQV